MPKRIPQGLARDLLRASESLLAAQAARKEYDPCAAPNFDPAIMLATIELERVIGEIRARRIKKD